MNKQRSSPKTSGAPLGRKKSVAPLPPLKSLEDLEGILTQAARSAHDLRQEHEKSLGLARKAPRKDTREKLRQSMEKLDAQLRHANSTYTRITTHPDFVAAPLPSPKRRGTKSGIPDGEQLGVIEREEARINDLVEKGKSDTEYGQASRRVLQEQQPHTQRKLRRLANGSRSVRVRGRADQAADQVEERPKEVEEHEQGVRV